MTFQCFCIWRFNFFVDNVDVLFWCVACLSDCLDDDEVFSDIFELLAFEESTGELSDDSLLSDDFLSLFRDELSLFDDSSSDDESEDESFSDVACLEKI